MSNASLKKEQSSSEEGVKKMEDGRSGASQLKIKREKLKMKMMNEE